MIDIRRAQGITGWMSDQELTWLATQAQTCDTIIEIGCWRGRSTRVLGDHVKPGGVVYAVDHWAGESPEMSELEARLAKPGALTSTIDYATLGSDGVYARFAANLKDLIASGRVVPMRATSVEAAHALAVCGVQADFVFIDGDHAEVSLLADLAAYVPLVRPGGLLAGHDYDRLAWHRDVKRVIDRAFAGRFALEHTIWWLRV